MADALGVSEQGVTDQGTSTDYLGVKSPTAFRGQPALPAGAGPIGAGAAPPATAGGKAPSGPLKPLDSGPIGQSTFADLSSAVGGDPGSEGPGTPGVGQLGGLPTAQGQFAGLNFAASPFGASARVGGPQGPGLSASPTGRLGFTTGNFAVDQALSYAASALNIPLGVNALSSLAALAGGPIGSLLGAFVGPAAAPFALVSLAHQIATGMPQSVTNLQQAIQEMNPEVQLTREQAHQIATYGKQAFEGPVIGGPQGIGNLAIDNPVMGPQGASYGLSATNPSIAGQNQFATNTTLADLAQSIFGTPTGRTDVGATTGPPSGPPGLSESEAASAAAAGITGGEASGPGSAPGDATGGGSEAGEA